MTTVADPAVHRLLRGCARLAGLLDELADVDPAFLATREKAEALVAFTRLERRVAALRLRILAGADDVARRDGARDAAAWLTHACRSDPYDDRADLRLAEAITGRWRRVEAGFAAGAVSRAQARVLVRALDALPPDLPEDILDRAEEHLVAACGDHGPRDLRILGRRILEIVAPGLAEAEEARALEREEARAWETASLVVRRLGDGRTQIRGLVPDAVGARLTGYLDAYTAPRGPATGPTGVSRADRIPADRARALAFGAFLEAVDPARLPIHGGDATAVLVSVSLDALRTELATAELIGEGPVSASEARRLACSARIIPVVLGGPSEPLDLGRARRLFSPAQRKALALRDRRCRAEGCTIPAAWCEAHHAGAPWSRGGRTDLADGRLLCGFHHRLAHDPRYRGERLANGDVRFHRRT